MDEGDFEVACREAIESGHFDEIKRNVSDFIIDSTGRIYHKGNHAGWIKREASPSDLIDAANDLGCRLPILTDMKAITESDS